MNPLVGKLDWFYQKHEHFVESLLLRRTSEFVYSRNPKPHKGEVVVFTFHIALPDWFDDQCRHLAENGYKCVSSADLLEMLHSRMAIPDKAVMITFDDGLKHVWTVAHPILEKYGLRATCFLIPGCVPNNETMIRPTMADVWEKRAVEADIVAFNRSEPALATWPEIRKMQASGIVDFQSHTMHHSLVSTSDEILDFLHPGFDPHFYGNVFVPLYRRNGVDALDRTPLLGMPIYRGAPRLQAESRYFDDETLRNKCVDFVASEGGESFFQQRTWRKALREVVKTHRATEPDRSSFETPAQRDRVVREELAHSREVIESNLGAGPVDQICFPWYEARPFAVKLAREAGFEAAYVGLASDRARNAPRNDPMRIVRVEDIFLQRLPGSGRQSLAGALGKLFDLKRESSSIFPPA